MNKIICNNCGNANSSYEVHCKRCNTNLYRTKEIYDNYLYFNII